MASADRVRIIAGEAPLSDLRHGQNKPLLPLAVEGGPKLCLQNLAGVSRSIRSRLNSYESKSNNNSDGPVGWPSTLRLRMESTRRKR